MPPAPPLGPTAVLFNLSTKKGHGLGIPFLKLFTTFLFYIRCLGTVPNFETRWLHQGAWFFNGSSLIFFRALSVITSRLQGFPIGMTILPSHHRFHQWEFFQHDTNVTGRHVCSIKFWDAHQQRLKKPRHVECLFHLRFDNAKLFCKESKLAFPGLLGLLGYLHCFLRFGIETPGNCPGNFGIL